MRRKTKGSSGGSAWGYWLLTAALLAAMGWVIWDKTRVTGTPGIAKSKFPIPPRQFQVTNRPPPAAKPPPQTAPPPITPLPAENRSVAGLNFRNVRNLQEAQVALARQAICSGSLDGALGSQTRAALRVWQKNQGLPATGELDPATKDRLSVEPPVTTTHTVTSSDLARLQPVASTWLGKSQQSALDYENLLELVAEKSHAHPALIRRLNPGFNWTNAAAGTPVVMPLIEYPPPQKASWLQISLSEKRLSAFDARTNLLAYFPVSIGAKMEKRPVGRLAVEVIVPNPNYTFDPDIFPESAEGRALGRKLVLPPGPNNPVGVAWIGLNRSGYGIHGTPVPENVGRTESHGCFRLANWNAEHLVRMVSVGTPVLVDP